MDRDDLRPDFRRERPDEFGKAGTGRPATYQGEKAVVPQVVVENRQSDALKLGTATQKAMKSWGLTRREARFLIELPGCTTLIEAWKRCFPKDKSSPANQRMKAARCRRSIIAKVGEDEMFELMGIGRQATMEKLRQLKDAKVVKAFITKDGDVVESREYEDNITQMNATKVLAQIHKMVDGEKGTAGQVTVNVIQYAPQGAPPWPGGGRN